MAPWELDELAWQVRAAARDLAAEAVFVAPVVGDLVLAPALVAVGDAHRVQVTPGPVLRVAVATGADGLVLLHTHLSDTPSSEADAAFTRRLRAASVLLGIELLAHLVVTPAEVHDVLGDRSERHPAA